MNGVGFRVSDIDKFTFILRVEFEAPGHIYPTVYKLGSYSNSQLLMQGFVFVDLRVDHITPVQIEAHICASESMFLLGRNVLRIFLSIHRAKSSCVSTSIIQLEYPRLVRESIDIIPEGVYNICRKPNAKPISISQQRPIPLTHLIYSDTLTIQTPSSFSLLKLLVLHMLSWSSHIKTLESGAPWISIFYLSHVKLLYVENPNSNLHFNKSLTLGWGFFSLSLSFSLSLLNFIQNNVIQLVCSSSLKPLSSRRWFSSSFLILLLVAN